MKYEYCLIMVLLMRKIIKLLNDLTPQAKIESAISKLGVPVQVLAAPRSTATRKPAPGTYSLVTVKPQ